MMLKLMCAVALCGSVYRIDGACISCCCDRVISFFKQVYHSGEADNEHIIYNDHALLDVRNEYDVVSETQYNERIIHNDHALLDVRNEYDVVPETQDNENLDFAKVLNIDNATASAYMLQINEMIEETKEKCTYVPDEEIEKVINDRNVDNLCTICCEELTNENRIFGLVAMIGCRHLFHAICFCRFYLAYKYVWCPNCRNWQ